MPGVMLMALVSVLTKLVVKNCFHLITARTFPVMHGLVCIARRIKSKHTLCRTNTHARQPHDECDINTAHTAIEIKTKKNIQQTTQHKIYNSASNSI